MLSKGMLIEVNEALYSIYYLLIESVLKDYKQKYPEIAKDLDQATTMGLKPKWLPWIVKNLKDGYNIANLVMLTQRFDKALPKIPKGQTDVGAWQKKSVKEFEVFVSEIESGPSISQQQDIERAIVSGAKNLYSDSRYLVYEIQSYGDIRALGTNTAWCITVEKYFKEFIKELLYAYGFYVFIDKHNLQPLTQHKTQFGTQWLVPALGKVCVLFIESTIPPFIQSFKAYDSFNVELDERDLERAFPMWRKLKRETLGKYGEITADFIHSAERFFALH